MDVTHIFVDVAREKSKESKIDFNTVLNLKISVKRCKFIDLASEIVSYQFALTILPNPIMVGSAYSVDPHPNRIKFKNLLI